MPATSEEAKARKRQADRDRIAAKRAAAKAGATSTVAPASRPRRAEPEGVSTSPFEVPSLSPPEGSSVFIPGEWESMRDSGIPPLKSSELVPDPSAREEFLTGATLLRMHGERAKRGARLTPQNLVVCDALSAFHPFFGLSMPRRSSKTSSLFMWAMGRVSSREDYLIAYTMLTTATKARARFRQDVAAPLEALFPDKKNRPFKISYAGGSERVEWDNGSMLAFLPPKGESFRSDAWDVIILDEAGEADVEMTADVTAGALSTMDTRPDAKLIFAGTAAKFRKGNALWDTLEDGRNGDRNTGIVEYAVDQDLTPDDFIEWEDAKRLVLGAHPGIGTLTTLDVVETRHGKLKPAAFAAEYCGLFGQVGTAAFLNQAKWADAKEDTSTLRIPERFTMAFQVHPDSTSASIVAAWREDDGKARLAVLWAGPVRGLNLKQLELGRRYRMPVGYDSGNAPTDSEAQRLGRARPAIRLIPQQWAHVSTAAALVTKEIDAGNLVHWDQPELNGAVALATKRGTRESKRWAFGRPDDEADITALEAGAIALRLYDENPPRVGLRAAAAID